MKATHQFIYFHNIISKMPEKRVSLLVKLCKCSAAVLTSNNFKLKATQNSKKSIFSTQDSLLQRKQLDVEKGCF